MKSLPAGILEINQNPPADGNETVNTKRPDESPQVEKTSRQKAPRLSPQFREQDACTAERGLANQELSEPIGTERANAPKGTVLSRNELQLGVRREGQRREVKRVQDADFWSPQAQRGNLEILRPPYSTNRLLLMHGSLFELLPIGDSVQKLSH